MSLNNNDKYDDMRFDGSSSSDDSDDSQTDLVMPLFRSLNLTTLSEPALSVRSSYDGVTKLPSAYGNMKSNAVLPSSESGYKLRTETIRKTSMATTTTTAPYGWVNPQFQRMSQFQPMSKHTINIPQVDSANIVNVTRQLYDVFRRLSLQVDFATQPTCTACCRTIEGIVFRINVWDNIRCRAYTLEVDRITGDHTEFLNTYANTIIQAVTDALNNVRCNIPAVLPTSFEGVTDSDVMQYDLTEGLVAQVCRNELPMYDNESSLFSVLHIVESLVTSRCFEQNAQGLQMLIQLTDPSQSGLTTAKAVSRKLLLDNREGPVVIRKVVLGAPSSHSIQSANSFDEREIMALSCLVQAIALLEPTEVVQFVSRNSILIDLMLLQMKVASTKPHVAAMAAHILSVICQNVPYDVKVGIERHAESIRCAYTFGLYHHTALEHATGRLLQQAS